MRLAIIIATLNSERWMKGCLDSIRASTYEDKMTLVVDGASRDGTVPYAKANYPEVTAIECPRNYGYAGGNDIGLGYTMSLGAEYVFAANPDIRLDPACLERLVEAMEQNPDFAVVGPMNYGIVEDEFEPAFRSMIQRDTTYLQDRAAGRAQRFYPLRYVIGCGILMRCATLKRVGLFDPAYITYGEETDLCTRIRFHGGKVMLDTNARLWHLADKPFNPRIAFFATRGAAMNILKRPDRPLLSRILHTQRYLGGIMGRSIRGAADSFQSWPVIKAVLWVNFFLPRILIRRRRELRLALPEGEFSFKQGLWPRARQEREP